MIGLAIVGTDYTYDVRGNILKVADLASLGKLQWEYNYDGDILTQAEQSKRIGSITYNFAHDSLGRMTFDGLNGLNIEYNILNLPKKIGNSDSTLVNYSYLADGTKISSLTQLGEGLVFRGPFTYRRHQSMVSMAAGMNSFQQERFRDSASGTISPARKTRNRTSAYLTATTEQGFTPLPSDVG